VLLILTQASWTAEYITHAADLLFKQSERAHTPARRKQVREVGSTTARATCFVHLWTDETVYAVLVQLYGQHALVSVCASQYGTLWSDQITGAWCGIVVLFL